MNLPLMLRSRVLLLRQPRAWLAMACLPLFGPLLIFAAYAAGHGTRAPLDNAPDRPAREAIKGGAINRPRLALQLGHNMEVIAVAYSPDSKLLASASRYFTGDFGAVKIWNVHSGDLMLTLRGPLEHVQAIAFAGDSRTLATGSADHTVRFWNAYTGELLRTLPTPGDVTSLAYSADGKLLAGAAIPRPAPGEPARPAPEDLDSSPESSEFPKSTAITLWDAGTLQELHTWQETGTVDRILFSPAGHTLISSSGPRLALWDTATAQLQQAFLPATKAGPASAMRGVAISPDGNMLAGALIDRVWVWNVRTGALEHTLPLKGQFDPMKCLAFGRDGKTLFAGLDGNGGATLLRRWNVATGKALPTLHGPGEGINDIAFAPDGNTFATGEERHILGFWDAHTARLKRPPLQFVAATGPVVFAPQGHSLITGNEDGTLRFWSLKSGRLWRTMNKLTGDIDALTCSSDGKWLVSSGEFNDESGLQVWEVATGKLLHHWPSPPAEVILISPDKSLLATLNGNSGSERTVRVLDARTGKLRRLMTGHEQPVTAAAFAPDGKTIASASYDATVKLWDVHEGIARKTLEGHQGPVLSLAYSADGRWIASGGQDKTIRLWDAQTGVSRYVLTGHTAPVSALRFLSDHTLLSSAYDGTFRRWNVADGTLMRTQRLSNDVAGARFLAPDGDRAAAVNGDGALDVLDTTTGQLLASLLVLPPDQETDISEEWIAYTPQGYYVSSQEADPFIRWNVRGTLFPAAQFEPQFRRPAEVQKSLAAARHP